MSTIAPHGPTLAPSRPQPDITGLERALHSSSSTLRDVVSPINQRVLGVVPWGRVDDVREAHSRVSAAQKVWAKTPLSTRQKIIARVHDLVLKRQEWLLDIIQWETGKARQSAFEEIADVAMTSRYYSRSAKRHLGPHWRAGALPLLTSTREHHVPKGVVGMITPWNYPFTLPLSDAIPALLAGNGIMLKPDPKTPFSALAGVALLREAGLPEDLFLVVTGEPQEVGPALIEHSDFVMFTGSTRTGRLVAEACAKRLIDFSAELGGKNPMIVLADAPLERAVEGTIAACFSNAGQLCMSVERLLVHESIAEEFVGRLTDRIRQLKIGVATDFSVEVGSLISADQLERVSRHVDDAVDRGATVLIGGSARPDLGAYVYEPTLLTGVTPDMVVCQEETFGPVVSVQTFSSDEEAIEKANESDYGLNASVWGSPRHARRVAWQIHAGSVNVNEGFTASWASLDAPMGGFKQSGVGRRHGRAGIVKYTDSQTVSVQRVLNIGAPKGMDGESFVRWMTRGLRILKWLPGRH